MEEESRQLKNWISNFERDRQMGRSPSIGKVVSNKETNTIGVAESLAALNINYETPPQVSAFAPIKKAPVIPAKKPAQPKKRFLKVPKKCIEKFNIEDFSTNNYKAIEAVINDILTKRKNKALAKKSKAKTDIRLKTLDGTGIPLEAHEISNHAEDAKKGKDIKPKSAQPRSYRYYYKKGVSEDKNQFETNVPKSINELNRVYKDAEKSLQRLNNKKILSRRMGAPDKVINKSIVKET